MEKVVIAFIILGLLIIYIAMGIVVYHIGGWIAVCIYIGISFLLGGMAMTGLMD